MTIPGERTKNGEQHVVPLSNTALEIVRTIERRDRDYVFGRTRAGGFSGWSKSKKELDAGLKLKEKWTLHDLRRTCATHVGEIGVEPHIIEAVLNHVTHF